MQKSFYKLMNIYYEDYKTGSTGSQRTRNKRYYKKKLRRKLKEIWEE